LRTFFAGEEVLSFSVHLVSSIDRFLPFSKRSGDFPRLPGEGELLQVFLSDSLIVSNRVLAAADSSYFFSGLEVLNLVNFSSRESGPSSLCLTNGLLLWLELKLLSTLLFLGDTSNFSLHISFNFSKSDSTTLLFARVTLFFICSCIFSSYASSTSISG